MELLGWVANSIDPDMSRQAENLRTLELLMPAPLLATLDWAPGGGTLAPVGVHLGKLLEHLY